MSESLTTLDESAVLRRLLSLLMASQEPPSWESLVPVGMPAIAAAFFLLDVEPASDVEMFITMTMSRLVQQLNRNTQQQQVEYRGQIRGRINWPATLKARYDRDYDLSRYVCCEVRHQYNTPENQLIKYVVEQIAACTRLIPETLRVGKCYYPSTGIRESRATADRLGQIETALSRLRRDARWHDIVLPEQINEWHLLRAETARTEEYAEVARIYKRYQQVVVALSREEITKIGKRVLPLPDHTGTDGDAWIQLGAYILRVQ
ncbi:MAG: DUF2357 domain-containing protein [Anaerolineae bacterium]|nr:DUF2357 domain-containing protein [Anaerolineae bacterium]